MVAGLEGAWTKLRWHFVLPCAEANISFIFVKRCDFFCFPSVEICTVARLGSLLTVNVLGNLKNDSQIFAQLSNRITNIEFITCQPTIANSMLCAVHLFTFCFKEIPNFIRHFNITILLSNCQ